MEAPHLCSFAPQFLLKDKKNVKTAGQGVQAGGFELVDSQSRNTAEVRFHTTIHHRENQSFPKAGGIIKVGEDSNSSGLRRLSGPVQGTEYSLDGGHYNIGVHTHSPFFHAIGHLYLNIGYCLGA